MGDGRFAVRLAVVLAGALAIPATAQEPSESAARRLGLSLDSAEEMTIRSDALEAAPDASGRDRVVFQDNVVVEQGSMKLHCDWLEAVYPKRADGSQARGKPEQITARGSVRIVQSGSEARCSQAVFSNQACSAECVTPGGKATLSRGGDVIEADRIVFDLCKGVLKASGGVQIRTQGSGPPVGPGG
jgi:lipopolysaccharide transport protein LptA